MLRFLCYLFYLTVIITLQTFAQETWVPFLQPTYSKPATNLTVSNNSNVSFNVQINGMETSDKKVDASAYQSLSIPDGEVMTKEGSPQMPMITKLIAIPDCDNFSISVIPSNQLQFANYNILPTPRYEKKKLPDGTDERILVFEEDKSVYSANTDFPGKYGEIIETGYVRGQKVARVAIYPIQFSPASKRIKVCTNINISLSFVNSSSPVNKELGIFRGMMHHIALNYEPSGINASTKISNTIKNNQLSKGSPESVTSGSVIRVTDLSTLKGTNAIPVDYLIITHSSLFNSVYLTQLANHRKDYNGYDVAIVVLDSIYVHYGNGYPPPPNYQRIRNFIADVFINGKANHTGDGHLGYICLVGDAVMLPAAYPPDSYPLYYTDLDQGSDYYYACTGGDSDDLQDVMYGRISVGNETELSNVVNKIISYESNSNGSWNNNCMFVASSPDFFGNFSFNTDSKIKQMLNTIPSSYPKSYAYRNTLGQVTSVTTTEANPIFGQSFDTSQYHDPNNLCGSDSLNDWLLNQLNATSGIHTFVFEDHGEWNTLNSNEGSGRHIYYLDDNNPNSINNRLNNTLYPFMIFNCCKTGDFDQYGNCLAEVSLNLANRGAIGVLASTRDSDPYSFGYVDQYILDAQYNNLSHIMGEAVMESKLLLASQYRRQFNLYGDPAVNLWPTGYTISQNLTLSGTNLISENITVASGVTLTISAGATLRFADGCSLIVNGVLSAVGTSTNPITFTSSSNNSAGNWGYITLDGSGASSSNLNHVNIRYGEGIQCLNGANATIQNSYIGTCTNGIIVNDAYPQILNDTIYNPVSNGIWCQSTAFSNGYWIGIAGNAIIKDGSETDYYQQGQGIWIENCDSPVIGTNIVKGFDWGIYNGNSCVFFATDSVRNNLVIKNLHGVAAQWGTTLFAGDEGDGFCVNNSFHDNTYNIICANESWTEAGYNYWGDGHRSYSDGSEIDFYSDLYTDPWGGQNLAVVKPGSKFGLNHINKTMGSISSSTDSLSMGFLLEKQGRISDAIVFYKNLIANDNHMRIALSQLVHIKNKYTRSELVDYFISLLPNNPKHYPNVKKLLGDIYLKNSQFDDALIAYDAVIKIDSAGYDGIMARFEKLFAYLNIKKNLTLATGILSDIKAINSKDLEVQMLIKGAESLINGTPKGMNKSENLAGVNIPKTYNLFQNYPNPFNPSTTIKYQIPKPGIVTLKVYDILGREVATLVSENKIEGTYDITFDASRFTSGVYIYQLRANDYVSSKKMILLK